MFNDVVICANPVAATHAVAVEMARRRGRIVLFGGLPKAEPMTRLNANLIHYGEQVVMGAFSYHPRHHAEALAMLARQQVRADQFVTHVQTLSRVAEAFATAAAGEALKVMVVPDRAIPSEALDRITARYLEERLEASPSMRPPRGGPRRK